MKRNVYISVTTMKLPKQHMDQVAEGFRRGAPDLKQFDGFLGFELWRSEDTLEAVSRWTSREAMDAYRQSDAFRAHHGGGAGQGQAAGGHPHGASGEAQGGTQMGGTVTYYDGEVVV